MNLVSERELTHSDIQIRFWVSPEHPQKMETTKYVYALATEIYMMRTGARHDDETTREEDMYMDQDGRVRRGGSINQATREESNDYDSGDSGTKSMWQ